MGKKHSESLSWRVSRWIVDRRNLIFLLYGFALIFCVVAMDWVNVENDVTKYLDEDTETRQGIEAMNANFESMGTGRVMVSNVTYETACEIAETLQEIPGIATVLFDDTPDHYTDASALYDVTFTGGNFDEESLSALEEINTRLAGYDLYVDTLVGYDENATLQEEMTTILILAVVIIIGVLILTSRSYLEVPVLLVTFGVAALLNMGTNFVFGTISFISDSVAVVLQLALAVDYAIILCHRFSDEHETLDARTAAITALSKSIPAISASSLTTIGGLVALGFMDFGIGCDMAVVMIKGILCSLLTVFTLMPGLLVLTCPLMDKTRHPRLLPNITFAGKFAVKARRVLPPAFLVVLCLAFWLSGKCPYAYSYTDLETAKMSEQKEAYFTIKETFGTNNTLALLVPAGAYESEGKILEELESRPEVKSAMGLANIEALDGYMLTDALTPRQLSEVLGLDYEVVQLLYTAYAAQNNEYGQIISGLDQYAVPMFDMFLFLKDQLETHNIQLSAADETSLTGMLDQLELAQAQMQSDNYSRLVIYLNLPEEGEETYAFLDEIRSIAGQYYDGDYYVVGNSTSSRDLADSFASDNLMISILSAFFVIVVLLFTFKSAGMPLLLIAVIQGSIWINFSIPVFTGVPLYFLGYLIVSAIMMGANIDYAIVISSRYQELKTQMPHKEAIVQTLNIAFPTVFTSGIMMSAAGLLIGGLSAQPVVSIMGSCLGRGTLISVFLVLFVLPSFLVLGDSIIERTRFHLKAPAPRTVQKTGMIRVQGRVRGYVSGVVDAEIHGVIRGQVDAAVSTGPQNSEELPPVGAHEEEGGGEDA